MHNKLEELIEKAKAAVAQVGDLKVLEELEIEYLGRKSEFSQFMKSLGALPPEDRRTFGQRANEAKKTIEGIFMEARAAFAARAAAAVAETEWIDVTVPGERPPEGHLHLTSQAIREITGIFAGMGFTRVRHPEVEWDWFAFESLNMPGDHPARDEWETFFMDASPDAKLGKMVLTPHTTSGDVREIQKGRLPVRMINISKTYRRQIDVSHVPMFHQFEGLLIDKGIAVTNLKGVLDRFAQEFFGPDRRTRLRPFHFRFTEPSFEIDVSCGVCGGTGIVASGAKCRLCKEGWLELGGAGMLHPNVLKAGGLDPDEWSALAFGWGVERTMMMKSGVRLDDIRELYRNDFRFLRQF